MTIWLFRKRTRRKRSIRAANTHAADEAPHLGRTQTPPALTTQTAAPAADDVLSPLRTSSRSLPNRERVQRQPTKLRRLTRTYSFEAGNKDEILVGRRQSARKSKQPVAPQASETPGSAPAASTRARPHLRRAGEEKREEARAPVHDSDHAIFDRVPTLYANKRDGGHLMTRKLTKRRKNSHDREREAELKALHDFTPVRPATDAWNSGRPLKKDTRRVKSGLSFVRPPWEREQHPSDVSLPIADSIHSSLSSDSVPIAYKVSALDVLAPKPTLKRSTNPRWTPSQSAQASSPGRTDSQKRKVSVKAQIPEATLRAHKRVDDLADDLDASDLRELMERDKRRRQRKREREQERLESRLARKAENQRKALENGAEAPLNLERGALGREAVGLGIVDTTSVVVTSSRRRSSADASSPRRGKSPADEPTADVAGADTEGHQDPLHVFHRVSSNVPVEPPTPAKEREEPTMPPIRDYSPRAKGFLRSKKSRSKSSLSENAQSDVSGTARKTSESSSRGPMSWTSIFKWGLRPKRSSGPSSFSNTSRDSMSTQPPAQAMAPFNVTFLPPAAGGRGSSVPKRTRSRFREDLPELPLSPPESRMQSPEHDAMPSVIMEQDSPPVGSMPTPSTPINIPGRRYDTPTSEGARRTPSSMLRDGMEVSPEPHQAISLASIDSEASWLSGRLKGGRLSAQSRQRRGSLPQRAARPFDGQDDAVETGDNVDDSAGIADDEYLHRVASRGSGARYSSAWHSHSSTGELRASSDDDDDARWGAVSGKQPELVRPGPAGRIKSREGLLNMVEPVSAPSEEPEPSSPISHVSQASDDMGDLQRATSINLAKIHARHISAGSAKLLDLSPRSSADIKRKSWPADRRLAEATSDAEPRSS